MAQIEIDSIQRYYKYYNIPALRCDDRLRIIWSNDEAAKRLGISGQPKLTDCFPRLDAEYIMEHLSDQCGFEVELEEQEFQIQFSFQPIVENEAFVCCFVLIRRQPRVESPTVFRSDGTSENKCAVSMFSLQSRFALAGIFNTLPLLKSTLERYDLYDEIEYLRDIADHSYNIMKLIYNSTEFNRLLYEKDYCRLQPVDLRLPLGNLLAGVKLLLIHSGTDFSYQVCEEPLIANADSERINLVLLQLISNACRFTSPGNRVMVTVGRQKQTITVRVSDKGVGIPSENLQSIFTPFFSFDPNTNSYAGIGLGLSYAQRVVRLHGGECIVSSSLNHGTTVSILLPIHQDPNPPLLHSDRFEYVLGRLSPISILLSDVGVIPID